MVSQKYMLIHSANGSHRRTLSLNQVSMVTKIVLFNSFEHTCQEVLASSQAEKSVHILEEWNIQTLLGIHLKSDWFRQGHLHSLQEKLKVRGQWGAQAKCR